MNYSTIPFLLIWLASIVSLAGAQQTTTTNVEVVIRFFGASALPEADVPTFLNITREEFNEFIQFNRLYLYAVANHDTVLVDNEARASFLEITFLHLFEHFVLVGGTEIGHEDFLNFLQFFYDDTTTPIELINELKQEIPGTFQDVDPALQIQVGPQNNSSSVSPLGTGVIVGIISGSVAVLLAGVGLLFAKGRKRNNNNEPEQVFEPAVPAVAVTLPSEPPSHNDALAEQTVEALEVLPVQMEPSVVQRNGGPEFKDQIRSNEDGRPRQQQQQRKSLPEFKDQTRGHEPAAGPLQQAKAVPTEERTEATEESVNNQSSSSKYARNINL